MSRPHFERVSSWILLIAIVIFWPECVTYWIDKGTMMDPSKVKIEIPQIELPPLDLNTK